MDTLLLGCTHYPFLARTISDVMGRDVVLVSSADETAFELRAFSGWEQIWVGTAARPGTHTWISSGDVEHLSPAGPPAARARDRPGGGVGPAGVTLTLTVLGCDGSFPGPGGACSGYLLTCEGQPGVARLLAAARWPTCSGT